MYIKRILSNKLKQLAKQFPVVFLTGPRQSGKTTLVKHTFPKLTYVSLEDLDMREFAQSDPRSFLANYSQGVIIDEAQRAPELFSYLQSIVDQNRKPGQFILTGSQNFLLHHQINQSLAGRVAVLKLLPLSLEELKQKKRNYEHYLYFGFYPKLYDSQISPTDWYANYIQTYIERDVRQLKNISDLATFQKFIKMCAARSGQLLNLTALADDCGITHNTAKAWLSVLEASFIIFLLKPHHQNFNKRLVKSPKLYFYDVGLAANLLGVTSPDQLISHYLKGDLFETLVIAEFFKHNFNLGQTENFYFWRDKTGHEIDCLIETAQQLTPIEIKSGRTISSDYFKSLNYWRKITRDEKQASFLIYGGETNQTRNSVKILSWKNLHQVF